MMTSVKRRRRDEIIARATIPIRKCHHIVKDVNQFGGSAPKWSIVSSRHDPRPPDPTPGPGHYYINSGIGSVKTGHVIGEKPEIDYRTVTSEIDYRSEQMFPEIRPMTIGTRSRLQYNYTTDEPREPVYLMNSSFTKPYWTMKISERLNERVPDPIPSPSRYNPVNPMLNTGPTFSLPRRGEQYQEVVNNSPGPGSYEVCAPVKSYTRWSERLMVKSNRWHPPENPDARPWKVKRK